MRLRFATLSRPMRRTLRFLLPIGLLGLVTVLLAACGGGSSNVPGNAVAKVGDASVTKSQFDHWLNVAAVSSAGQQQSSAAAARTAAPDPPSYARCIAQRKKAAPKPAKGQPTPTDAQYKAQCQQQYQSLRDQVMSFLISAQWIQQEAKDRKIELTGAQVQKAFQTTKKQSFPKEADYQKFLKSSGMTQADILFRVKLDSLSNKLRAAVTKGKDAVTPAQIRSYYDKNKARFATPETRDVRIVLTKTQAQADRAKKALQGGQSWKTVAKRFSIDQASKNQAGKLSGITKGQQEKALDTAIFGAKTGKLSGPIKTQFGWYDFRVDKITPASQQTEQQSQATIKQLLSSQGQQKALDAFVKGFQKKWRAQTNCRKEYVTQDCKNAPPAKTSTATPGAAPATTAP